MVGEGSDAPHCSNTTSWYALDDLRVGECARELVDRRSCEGSDSCVGVKREEWNEGGR